MSNLYEQYSVNQHQAQKVTFKIQHYA